MNGYDGYGRQRAVIDARNGATISTFTNDLVLSVTTPPPGNGVPNQTTRTWYNKMLQATNVVQPDGASVFTAYNLLGQVERTWGARVYPVEYTYDYSGRLTTMKTWQDFGDKSGTAITRWHYDTSRGWLTNKEYADGRGPRYTYTAAGRLATRAWARGVTTTYGYNDAGELSTIDYSDATPDQTFAHNRLGQRVGISVGAMGAALFFSPLGQMLGEAYTGGPLDGLRLTNRFDLYLRRTNLAFYGPGGLLHSTSYGYDTASRLAGVTNDAAAAKYSAVYSYLANSPLIEQVTFRSNSFTAMTTTRQHDNRNRLLSIQSLDPQLAPITSFAYTYNAANQRTRRTEADGSHWAFGYDSLGQVTSGKRNWADGTPVAGQQFEYVFDDIGNRISTKAGGDQGGANLRPAAYTRNALNQYESRTVPGGIDIIGASYPTNAVTVNGQATYRKVEYFRKELVYNNTNALIWTNVTVVASNQTPVTGNLFLAQSPEVFRYDLDGSLTNDGRWYYYWDAENRLVAMTNIPGVPTTAKMALTFAYDWHGRRIEKCVYTNTGSAYVPSYTQRYVYDGWNMAATLNAASQAVQTYTWGLDLSGTLHGAGGVGGLLFICDCASVICHCPAYDGNGNIMALLTTANGSVTARYEYGPFGEVIRATGPMAKANPFQFSTKYQDHETELIIFPLRDLSVALGRWLVRDLIHENGGAALYGYVQNSPVFRVDPLGLWKLGDHKKITSESLALALATIKPDVPAGCLENIYKMIWDENKRQDLNEFNDLRRHYNRPLVNNTRASPDQEYENYIRAEYEIWFDMKENPSHEKCWKAIAALGRISHSHEDFFAHAIRRDHEGGFEPHSPSTAQGWLAWTAIPPITGDPYHRYSFYPSTYSITGGGEHPPIDEPLVKGGAEYNARFKAAKEFELDVFKTVLPVWFEKCKCYCK